MVHNWITHICFDLSYVYERAIKRNNAVNTCLVRLNVILYHSWTLNTCECLICQIYQQNCNIWWKNHTHFDLKTLL